jgi:hypothetical protein
VLAPTEGLGGAALVGGVLHQFVSLESREFAESMGIKLFNSSPYYAQANGQAKASNKIMIKLIQKKIDQKPRRWH